MTSGKIRVAILGGGLGAISAAYRLTDPAAGDRFDVTVYQQGWRLGGKGASGRNMDMGARIEEHGLHMFMGWYDQGFKLMRECYAEWDTPPGHPYGTIAEAFTPQRSITLSENLAPAGQDPDWAFWTIPFPPLPGEPGDDRDEIHPLEFLRKLLAWLEKPAEELGIELLRKENAHPKARWLGHELAHSMADDYEEHAPNLLALLEDLVKATRATIGHDFQSVSRDLHQAWIFFELGLAIAKGLILDVIPHGHDGWQHINSLDLKDWLNKHGAATPEVSFSSPIRAFYDLAFAYVGGDTSSYQNAQIAAGAALRTMLKVAFGYRDAPLWRMSAGMGDVIFTPMYQVLKRRGVNVEFFHRVSELNLSPDERSVSSIDLTVQAKLAGASYDPFVKVGVTDVWPNQPNWDQLDNGAALKSQGVNFESVWDKTHVGTRTLVQGTDYDVVVLGISLGGLPFVARQLLDANDDWGKMADQVATVETQSIQLWTVPNLEELGWEHGPLVGTSYVEPVDSFADMSQVLAQEDWGDDPPGAVEYLCGPMAQLMSDPWKDPAYPLQAKAYVVSHASDYMTQSAARIWSAFQGPNGVDYGKLYDPSGGTGVKRLAAQYFRANVDPSERYVLTPPDTVQYRLDPADPGFDNVFPAGDWVRTSVNGGSAEAAIEGGNMAAAAIIARFA